MTHDQVLESIWLVSKATHNAIRSFARPYIVANWAVHPDDRVWPANRITVSYKVTLQ